MTERQGLLLRAYLVYSLFVIGMVLVIVQVFRIQLDKTGKQKSELSNDDSAGKMPIRYVKRYPRMGEVLDCNGVSLVTSISYYDLYMDPTVPSKELFDDQITDLSIKMNKMFPNLYETERQFENIVRRERRQGRRYLKIKDKVTNEQRRFIKSFPIFKEGRNKGGLIDNQEIIIRKRPFGDLLKRTLGYYQHTPGKPELRVGIEGAFHNYLAGETGEEVEQKLATGWKKRGQITKEAIEGADVITSIDKEIQEVAQNELNKQLKDKKANNGCVIVMDVKTGFVKAIANLAMSEEDGKYYELYNQAIGMKEVPGSTFKLASLMAGLEDDKFKITDTVQAASSYTYRGRTLNEAKRHNYGRITIQQAFEKSSNVISKIIYKAYKDEPQEFLRHLDEFGLTEPLGIDLAGEPNPTVHRPGTKKWSGLSLPWMAVGYEFQQTPLQTLAFYNSIANEGKLVRPQFVQEIRRGTQVIKTFQPVVLRQKICSKSTLEILKGCLEGVMTNGTGKKLTSSYFEIAGKTGTAQVMNDRSVKAGKGERIFLASFVGYFPVKNPRYSCIVSVEAIGENVYGSVMSGTVFSAIANKVYASSLKYHKAINEKGKRVWEIPVTKDGNQYDLKKILRKLKIPFKQSSQDEWISTEKQQNSIEFHKRLITKNLVPDVLGMNAKDAVYLIENAGMHVSLKGYGKVTKQSVFPGKQIYRGGLIELTLN
jgi:cell division protein FtsI (penicillin-binding protein 3)